MTEIVSKTRNSDSPWIERHDTIERIARDLAEHTLDPVFEQYGDFCDRSPEWLTKEAEEKYVGCVWCFDSDLYAKGRAYNRMLKAKRTILRGRVYRPHFGYRIPDWAVKGEMILNSSSQWLDFNITPSQRAFAREIAMQKKGW